MSDHHIFMSNKIVYLFFNFITSVPNVASKVTFEGVQKRQKVAYNPIKPDKTKQSITNFATNF